MTIQRRRHTAGRWMMTLTIGCASAWAGETPAPDAGTLRVNPYGGLAVGPVTGQIVHWASGWKSSHQDKITVQTAPGSPVEADGGWSLEGWYSTRDAEEFTLRQTLRPVPGTPGAVDCAYAVAAVDSEKPPQTSDMALIWYIPAAAFAGKASVIVDGEAIPLPEKAGEDAIFKRKNAHAVSFAYAEGRTLGLNGDFTVQVRDLRRHGEQRFGIQFALGQPAGQRLAEGGIAFRLALTPPPPDTAFVAAAADADAQRRLFRAGPDWTPYAFDPTAEAGGALDFSFLLDAPAGKHGPVVIRDGRFEFENKPGVPARFYGTNFVYNRNFPASDDAGAVADNIARSGYNAVRFHHFDQLIATKSGHDSTVLDPAMVDRMDRLIAELEKRGIYWSIDLISARGFRAGELAGLPDASKYDPKAVLMLHPEGRASWKTFAENLLNHVNPYTGLAWKDDPALFSLCLVNEGNIQNLWLWHRRNRPFIAERYNRWAKENGQPLYHADITPKAGAENDPLYRWLKENDPAKIAAYEDWAVENGQPVYDAERAKKTLATAEAALYAWMARTYREFVADSVQWLRGMGLKAKITDMNFIPLQGLTVLREDLDYVDMHGYWDHPKDGWGFPFRHDMKCAIAAGPRGLIVGNIDRLYGKPYAATEFNHVFPNPYRMEGAPLVAAHSALQGHDALFRFDAGAWKPAPIAYMGNGNDPAAMLSERFGLMMFLRGDVRESTRRYAWIVPAERAARTSTGDFARDMYPEALAAVGFVGQTGSVIRHGRPDEKLPPGLDAAFGDERDLGGRAALDAYLDGRPFGTTADIGKLVQGGTLDQPNKRIVSDTGEIDFQWNVPRFAVVTALTETVTTGAAAPWRGKVLGFEGDGGFVFAGLTALDGVPLAQSRRMLLAHVRDVKNTDMRFRNAGRDVLDWGRLPQLVARGRGTVTLAVDRPEELRVYALDGAGRRLGPVAGLAVADGAVTFPVDTRWSDEAATLAYEVVRE